MFVFTAWCCGLQGSGYRNKACGAGIELDCRITSFKN